jgi:hypothetical protein
LQANGYRILWADGLRHTTCALPGVIDAAASARISPCLELETNAVLADPPSSVERLSPNPDERPGRGAVLALFIAVVFLAGVFLGASLTGSPTAVKSESKPVTPVVAPGVGERQAAVSDTMQKAPPASPAESANIASPPAPAVAPAPSVLPPAAPAPPTPAPEPATTIPSLPEAPPTLPQVGTHAAGPAQPALTAAEIDALLVRGEALLQTGRGGDARPLLERAAVAGNGAAAMRLGQTYDPAFLARMRWQGIHADAGLAVFWYRRGQELGNGEAAYWLRQSEVAARARWNAK